MTRSFGDVLIKDQKSDNFECVFEEGFRGELIGWFCCSVFSVLIFLAQLRSRRLWRSVWWWERTSSC
jgi:hypothetical protein